MLLPMRMSPLPRLCVAVFAFEAIAYSFTQFAQIISANCLATTRLTFEIILVTWCTCVCYNTDTLSTAKYPPPPMGCDVAGLRKYI